MKTVYLQGTLILLKPGAYPQNGRSRQGVDNSFYCKNTQDRVEEPGCIFTIGGQNILFACGGPQAGLNSVMPVYVKSSKKDLTRPLHNVLFCFVSVSDSNLMAS